MVLWLEIVLLELEEYKWGLCVRVGIFMVIDEGDSGFCELFIGFEFL